MLPEEDDIEVNPIPSEDPIIHNKDEQDSTIENERASQEFISNLIEQAVEEIKPSEDLETCPYTWSEACIASEVIP